MLSDFNQIQNKILFDLFIFLKYHFNSSLYDIVKDCAVIYFMFSFRGRSNKPYFKVDDAQHHALRLTLHYISENSAPLSTRYLKFMIFSRAGKKLLHNSFFYSLSILRHYKIFIKQMF